MTLGLPPGERDRYTARYVPASVDRAVGWLAESPLGVPLRPWTPESRLLRVAVVVLTLTPTLLVEVSPFAGLGYLVIWTLTWTLSPKVGPWLWSALAVAAYLPTRPEFPVEISATLDEAMATVVGPTASRLGVTTTQFEVTPVVAAAFGGLAATSLAYYLFVRGSVLDPYSERSLGAAVDGLAGERKYADDAAEVAHRTAQERDPPVDVGETYTLVVKDLSDSGQPVAKHETFTVFVDQDYPDDASVGDTVCAQVTHFGGGERGNVTAAHARWLGRGQC